MAVFLFTFLRALALVFVFIGQARGQSQTPTLTASSASTTLSETASTTSSSTSSQPTSTSLTRVVQVFFIDERSYEGLAYTMLHQDQVSLCSLLFPLHFPWRENKRKPLETKQGIGTKAKKKKEGRKD